MPKGKRQFVVPKSSDTFESVARSLAEPGNALRESMDRLSQSATKAIREFASTMETSVHQSLSQVAEAIRKLPAQQRSVWIDAAFHGWFINWHTTMPIGWRKVDGYAALDAYMIAHLEEDWDEIVSSILVAYPERAEVLSCAFDLHKERRYVAAIPLMLAQADGICAQRLGAHLFTDNGQRDERIAELQATNGGLIAILLEILGLKTQFGAGIRKSSARMKQLAPNRNGILHGARKHLDYGTEVNSFKSLSLLAFVSFSLSELGSAEGGG